MESIYRWRSCLIDISGPDKLKKQAHQFEEYVQLMVERMPIALIVWDIHFRAQYWNPAAENMFGFTRREAIGKHAYGFIIPPEMQFHADSIWDRLFQGDVIADSINENMTKSGSRIICHWSNTLLKQTDGTPIGVLSMAQDITQTQQAEKALRNNERNLRLLFQQSQDGIALIDRQGAVVEWNEAQEQLTGLKRAEVIGQAIWDVQFGLVPDELKGMRPLEKIRSQEWDCLKTKRASWLNRLVEDEIQRPDGERRIIQSKIFLIEMGENFMLGTILRDITQPKNALKALQDSENKYRSLVNNVKLGIFRSTTKGRYLEVNKAMETITGYSREELLSMNIADLYWYPEERPLILEQLISHPEKANKEIRNKKKDGSQIIVSVTLTPIKDATGQVLYFDGILEDITERKGFEDQFKDLYVKEKQERKELEEEAKARGLFIEVLGHELRTPLTPIVASIGLLRDTFNQNPESMESKMINNVAEGAEILIQRLDELLDLGRFTRGEVTLELQTVDLARFIVDIGSRFDLVVRKRGQKLVLAVAENLPQIKVDPIRLNQVLINLLSNANKLSPEGGNITFRTEKAEGGILIEVLDDGKGISLEEQKRLFQPYHRVEQDRNEFTGIGLRLALSRQIIEMHGGRMWVTNRSDRGNTFSVYLPNRPE